MGGEHARRTAFSPPCRRSESGDNPLHLTNPAILSALLGRFRSEMGLDVRFMVEAGALHAGCVLFKSSPALGVGLLTAPAIAAFEVRRRPEVRFLLLAFWG